MAQAFNRLVFRQAFRGSWKAGFADHRQQMLSFLFYLGFEASAEPWDIGGCFLRDGPDVVLLTYQRART